MIIAAYPGKNYADFTTADRAAARHFAQGTAHAKQGRTDLLGKNADYDAGYHTQTGERSGVANFVDYKTYCIARSQQGLQVLPETLFDAIRANY